MSNLTLGSLFSGSGGFELAGIIAGIKPIWNCEIEPFPVRVTTKRLPEVKHYGDISGLNGAEVEPVDIITFGSPCFPAGTLVLTDKGYRPIEAIKVGAKVLTHRGRWRKVTDIGAKLGETVVVKGNHYGLECTPNHPIYSAKIHKYYPQLANGKRGNIRLISNEKKWTPAENMQGRLWAVPHSFEPLPIPHPYHDGTSKLKNLPEFDEDFFYLVGRWIGDGWVRDGQRYDRPKGQCCGTIIICAGYDKEEKLKSAIEAVVENYSVERCRTAVKYKFTSLLLCEWLVDNFGKYAHGKGIPSWAFSMPESWRMALLQGILDTDGYRSTETTYKVTTVSKKLAHGIRLLAETLGFSTTIYYVEMPPTCEIEGRTCNQRDQYVVQITASHNRSRLSDEFHSWYKVRGVKKTGENKLVYNMTVEEDNSYVADGIVVHNCQDMSIAGKRDGLDGSRSGLFYEAIRIVKEMREKTNGEKPRFIVWENVPGAFSSNKGQDFKAVLEAVIGVKEPAAEVPAPEKGKWPYADYYVGNGWSVGYRVLDAQWWGVPQRRARIFLVADFAGECAKEILFESEGVSGYSAEGFRSWQRAAGNPEESIGAAGCTGFDGYNGSITGEVSSTLGVNCGMSTGRNGIVLNDQGGSRMDVTENVTATLRAEAHHPPVVVDEADEPQAFHINQRNEGIDLHGVSGALMATQNQQMQTFVVEKLNPPDAAGFCTEHSAKARGIGYEEEKAPTLRAGVVPAAMTKEAIPLEHHPTDSRIGIEKGNAIQTLTSRMGTGGNNVPLIMTPDGPLVPKTLKLRGGRLGGGKGPLLQEDKSATLGCNNDQTVFVPAPKAYGISSMASNGMKSDNPKVGFYEADTSRTIDVSGGNPSSNQGGIAIVAFAQNQRDEVRELGDKSGALQAEPGMKQQTYVAEPAYSLQGNMIGRKLENGPQGNGVNEEISFTLDAVDRHAVAYGLDRASYNQGKNAKFGFQVEEELEPTMISRGPNAVAHPSYSMTTGSFMQVNKEKTSTLAARDYKDPPIVNGEEAEPYYIVRRLTPTECARLQGFPDWWCADLAVAQPTEEDIKFWTGVWEDHRAVVGGSSKPKTEKQVIKWLKAPHSDAAEYKLWGNGICLPVVYFVLSGIAWAAQKGAVNE